MTHTFSDRKDSSADGAGGSHTPGPWIQWADTNIIIRLHSGRPNAEDLRICEVATNTWKDEGRHNARLIAAAPDLLKALQKVVAFWDSITMNDRVNDIHDQARAAIAKAGGAV